jgi:glycosyltransferase involved in cell wall biosynthesis
MIDGKRKILFISHDASRTGAPFVLLHLLRWIKKNTDIEFEILLKNGGELEKEFESIAQTHYWNCGDKSKNFTQNILKKVGILQGDTNQEKSRLIEEIKNKKFDLIFANSVASSDVAVEIKRETKIPTILYIHELEISIRQYCGLEVFDQAKMMLDFFIGSSRLVYENLKENHKISEDRLGLVFDYIPAKEYHENKENFNKEKNRKKMGIPSSAFVVGSCGTIDWRKGVDLIPQIARLTKEKSDLLIYFFWFGGYQNGIDFEKIMYDVKNLDLKENVIFTDYALEKFSAIDVFLLSSREDPFPLVCLEAASLEKPIICFDNAGGMPDFVDKDAGFVAPYLNIEIVSEKIIELAKNIKLSDSLGKNAAQKVINNYDVEIAGKKILAIIDQNIKRIKGEQ